MLFFLVFLVGLVLLVKGADFLVDGSSSLAKKMGVPAIAIGLTIVAFGTSLPELTVNIFASFSHNADIAIGNIVGSNIFNILIVLGASALVAPLAVKRDTIWKEIPFSLLAALILFAIGSDALFGGADSTLSRVDGLLFISFFLVFLYYIFLMCKKNRVEIGKIEEMPYWKISALILSGIVLLIFGGKFTVDGAIEIARFLGVSEALIGLTIVSVGTSLPELVTSVVAARKGQMDLAVGNVVGSNIFNIFLILGVSSIISPISFSAFYLVDLALLVFATLLLFAFMFVGKRHTLERWQGASFIVLYLAYLAFLVWRG